MANLLALHAFVLAARSKSLSAAGRDRGISQPTMSRLISSLELEGGSALFSRTTRSLSLTDKGTDFLSKIAPILRKLDTTMQAK